jgi:competence protein ComEC
VEALLNRGTMELVILDVGQGDAIAIRSPRNRWALVDAGPRSPTFDAGQGRVLPFLRQRGVRRLEMVFLTHPDMDHVGGAPAVLGGMGVGAVVDPGLPAGKEVYLEALEAAEESGVPWNAARSGDSLDLDGIAIRVLSPEARPPAGPTPPSRTSGEEGSNEGSLVMELRFGSFAALLTGDAPIPVEEGFLGKIQSTSVQVLKVGHHGSGSSTSPELLERLSPQAALISVGRRNRYGHPHPEVLRRLESAGAEVYRTDRWGTLVLRARRNGSFRVRDGSG